MCTVLLMLRRLALKVSCVILVGASRRSTSGKLVSSMPTTVRRSRPLLGTATPFPVELMPTGVCCRPHSLRDSEFTCLVVVCSDGFLENGIGIDDYLALCERIGMKPAITVALQFGTDIELADAVDWWNYLNGDASSNSWAAERAKRGHSEPYNVKYW